MSTLYCAATFTRYPGTTCGRNSTYLVGIPGLGTDKWRGACTAHLAKVVDERVETLSDNGKVVVASVTALNAPAGTA